MSNATSHPLASSMTFDRANDAGTRAAASPDAQVPLRAEGLTVSFGGLTAVKNLDLEVRRHEVHALIGPNGAGKTTAVNALSGFIAPTAGRVWIDGVTSPRWRSHTLARAGLARTFQNIRLFGAMSVLESVLVGAHVHFRSGPVAALLRTRSARAEERAALEEARRVIAFVGLPASVEAVQATTLSYGHQRRVELARALVSRPKVLLLDEPLAGMNVTEKLELTELVRKITASGVAILLIEHDMEVIRALADRVTVLHHGSKLVEGTVHAVLAHDDVQAAYLGRAR